MVTLVTRDVNKKEVKNKYLKFQAVIKGIDNFILLKLNKNKNRKGIKSG